MKTALDIIEARVASEKHHKVELGDLPKRIEIFGLTFKEHSIGVLDSQYKCDEGLDLTFRQRYDETKAVISVEPSTDNMYRNIQSGSDEYVFRFPYESIYKLIKDIETLIKRKENASIRSCFREAGAKF